MRLCLGYIGFRPYSQFSHLVNPPHLLQSMLVVQATPYPALPVIAYLVAGYPGTYNTRPCRLSPSQPLDTRYLPNTRQYRFSLSHMFTRAPIPGGTYDQGLGRCISTNQIPIISVRIRIGIIGPRTTPLRSPPLLPLQCIQLQPVLQPLLALQKNRQSTTLLTTAISVITDYND